MKYRINRLFSQVVNVILQSIIYLGHFHPLNFNRDLFYSSSFDYISYIPNQIMFKMEKVDLKTSEEFFVHCYWM